MQVLVDAPYISSLRPPLLHNSITANLSLLNARAEFLSGKHKGTQHTLAASPAFQYGYRSTYCYLLPRLTESQENVSPLKTFWKWNQWDSDKPLQSNAPPALRGVEGFRLQPCTFGGRDGAVLGLALASCAFFWRFKADRKNTADEPKKEVITNKMRWFFSCESVDSTSYRPACRRQWHM